MSHPLDLPRLSRLARCGLVLAALGLTTVIGTARWLKPDPRGFGTHQQLGLPACGFAERMGMQCPTCGMTTSFAWMSRGRFDRAWSANPAGSVLFVVAGVLVFWFLAGAIRGRPVGVRTLETPLTLLVVVTAGFSLLAWMIRLGLGRVLR